MSAAYASAKRLNISFHSMMKKSIYHRSIRIALEPYVPHGRTIAFNAHCCKPLHAKKSSILLDEVTKCKRGIVSRIPRVTGKT